MAASAIPPIRLGLIGTGLAVEKLHWPALHTLADRYVVTAFTDSSAEQGTRFARYSGTDPARATADRAALLARDDVDAVLISVPIPHLYEVARDPSAARAAMREHLSNNYSTLLAEKEQRSKRAAKRR